MLTENQKRWIGNLRDDDEVKIYPFDKISEEKFKKVKAEILERILREIDVEHRGSTSLGIAGQNEIDMYIPLSPEEFCNGEFVSELTALYGPPKSIHKTRTRFQTIEDGKKIDIFLIDEESSEWLDGLKFEDYLKNHEEALREYEELKYRCDGLSTRKFYEKKVAFINDILSR